MAWVIGWVPTPCEAAWCPNWPFLGLSAVVPSFCGIIDAIGHGPLSLGSWQQPSKILGITLNCDWTIRGKIALIVESWKAYSSSELAFDPLYFFKVESPRPPPPPFFHLPGLQLTLHSLSPRWFKVRSPKMRSWDCVTETPGWISRRRPSGRCYQRNIGHQWMDEKMWEGKDEQHSRYMGAVRRSRVIQSKSQLSLVDICTCRYIFVDMIFMIFLYVVYVYM